MYVFFFYLSRSLDILNLFPQPGMSVTQDVSVAIGLQNCPTSAKFSGNTCDGVASALGNEILFAGPFAPEMIPGSGMTDKVQDFHLQVPADLTPGPAILTVSHFFLGRSAAVSSVDSFAKGEVLTRLFWA